MCKVRGIKFCGFALLAVLLLALVVVAAGCGSSSTTTTTVAPTTTASEATTTTAAGSTTTASAGSTTTVASTGTTLGTGLPLAAVNKSLWQGKKIVEITPYYSGVGAGPEEPDTLTDMLKARGATVTLDNGSGDYSKLISFFEQAIAQKVDAIINISTPANLLGTALADAHAAGIPVFSYNAYANPDVVAAVHQDAGTTELALAEIFCKSINYTGNVVLATQTDDANILIISKAITDTIAKYPNIHILQNVQPDHKNDVDALKTAMTAILTANPKVGSVAGAIAAWGDPAVGMEEAAEALGRTELKIVGSDGTQPEMEQMLLPKPVAIASMHQDWPNICAKVADTMQAYWDGSNKTFGQEYVYPSLVIDTPALAQARLTFLQNLPFNLTSTTAF
jgi:ABC-type sugar transport system substrate-binding protein